jgi:hypothetical protein
MRVDPRLNRMSPPQRVQVERIARQIARGLGHNDDVGMEWERYIAPAVIIVNENSIHISLV